MPIFGSRDLFGRSRFGQANYGELSLYELLPDVHRALDEEQGHPLRKLLSAFQEEMEDIRRQIDRLPYQRDPYFATGLDYPKDMLIVAATNTADGVQLRSDVDHDLSGVDQVDILGAPNDMLAGRYSVIRVIDERNFVIQAPPLANPALMVKVPMNRAAENTCLVEIAKIDVYTEQWGDSAQNLSKMTLTNTSQVRDLGIGYVGVLEAYKPVPPPENAFVEPSRALYRVLSIRRRDQAIGAPVELICEGGQRLEDIEGDLPERLVMRFHRPSSLSLLANDYGLVTDENLPDVFQRAEIANVYQFLRLKSSRPAYEARSRGGGFRVTVTHLYRICESVIGTIPEHNVFVGETGGGNTAYYANLNVVKPLYDDLSADLVLPGGIPITDINFYAAPALTTYDRRVDEFFKCMFKVICTKKVLVELPESYNRFGRSRPFYFIDIEVPNYPNEGWQVGTVNNGSFSLVDANGLEYLIDSTEHPGGGLRQLTTIVLDLDRVFFEVGDELCVTYRPETERVDCCFCPSAEIMIEIEALPAFINQSGYSGSALADAYSRILSRIKREQVPVHVHVAIETLVVNIDVEVPAFTVSALPELTIEEIVVDFDGGQRYDCRYDDLPADIEPTDTCADVTTYPGVVIGVEPPVFDPASQLVVDIVLEPLAAPLVDLMIETGVIRDIMIDGSSFYDLTPADAVETDNNLVGIEPVVTIEIE